MRLWGALALLLLCVTPVQGTEALRVCIVPHSHTDPGWKATFEEYHEASVQHILRNTFLDLLRNSSHKFVWSESSYLHRWLSKMPPAEEEWFNILRRLLASKQLEFVGGGWVQHDEALVTPYAAIAQMSEGLRWLKATFNATVETGYQIDPFGHSSLTPVLFRAVGFKQAVINRIDWRKKASMGRAGAKEFMWSANADDSAAESLLTHLVYDHYSSRADVEGYDFERKSKAITDTNVAARATKFTEMMRSRRSHYPTNELLFLWGDDFRFTNPAVMFSSMDKLIAYITQYQATLGISASYCVLSEYFARVQQAVSTLWLTTHVGSFFPYSASVLDPWTGFYATRPLLKKRIREAEAALRTAELLQAAATLSDINSTFHEKQIVSARRLFSILQHHDAVTGTCKPRVYTDYTAKVLDLTATAERVSGAYLSLLLKLNSTLSSLGSAEFAVSIAPTVSSIYLVNALSTPRNETVELAAASPLSVTHEGAALPVSVVQVNDSTYLTFFSTALLPLSASLFTLSPDPSLPVTRPVLVHTQDSLSVCPSSSSLGAKFSPIGDLQSLDAADASPIALSPSFRSYASGKWLGSGAYLFRIRFWPSFLIGLGIGSLPGSLAGAVLRLALNRLGRKHTPRLLGTTRRAMLAGLVIGALLFYTLSRRSVHDEMGDQMLGLQVGVFLAAVSCTLAGAYRHSIIVFFVVLGFATAFTFLPSLHSHSVDLGPRSLTLTRTAHFEELQVTSPSAGLAYRSRVYASGQLMDVLYEVSMNSRPNEELVARFPLGFSFTTESDDGVHLNKRSGYSYLDLVPRNYYPLIMHLRLNASVSSLSFFSAQSLGFGVLPSSVEIKLHRRLMQDDEQGLDAAIDDSEEAARLHFWVAPNGTQEMGERLNSPLRIFSASPAATLPSLRVLLSPLPGLALLHAVAISARSVGLIFSAQTDECIADHSVMALLRQWSKYCQATASDALFSPTYALPCRRHIAAYRMECNEAIR